MKKIFMMMFVLMLLSACEVSYDMPDSGMLDDASQSEMTEISSVDACAMIQWAHVYARYGREACAGISCPWPGFSGPGAPAQTCDLQRVFECAQKVSAANDCNQYQLALDFCPPDVCHD